MGLGLKSIARGAAVCALAVSVMAPAQAADGTCRALLISGMPGSEVYAGRYRDWLRRMRSHLESVGVASDNIVRVPADPSADSSVDAAQIIAALEAFSRVTSSSDQAIIVIVGHGDVTRDPPSLVVRGRDLDATTMADALQGLRARNQLILNFSGSSGAFVRSLARSDRVIVSANAPTEGIEPVFAEFFLRALESKRADGFGAPDAGAKDGRITILEAYNWATLHVAQWISRQSYSSEAGWRIDGSESAAIFKKLCSGPTGALGARRLDPSSRTDGPDAPVELQPEGAEIPMSWAARRAVTEHAALEDCGEEIPVSALFPAEVANAMGAADEQAMTRGFAPLAGKRTGEPGNRARRVVIGTVDLLSE